jgi:hypothetical protein
MNNFKGLIMVKKIAITLSLIISISNAQAKELEIINGVDFFQLGTKKSEIELRVKQAGGKKIEPSIDDHAFHPAADPIMYEKIKTKDFKLNWVNAFFHKNKLYRVEIFYSPWVVNNDDNGFSQGFSFDQEAHRDFKKILISLKQKYKFTTPAETETFLETGDKYACDKPVIVQQKISKISSAENIAAVYTETKLIEPVSRRELSINDAATMECQYPAEASINVYYQDTNTEIMLLNDKKRLEYEEEIRSNNNY